MRLDEMRQMSAELFATESKGTTKETAPPLITTAIVDFALSIGANKPDYVTVVDDEMGLYGFCSDGVSNRVRQSGGRALFGWLIWEHPEVLYTAEFHAVWEAPDGRVLDITPKPAGETRIAFAVAPSYPADFNFLKRPTNRLRRAYVPADPIAIATAKRDGLTTTQLAYETKRAEKAGFTLLEWLITRVPADPKAAIIDEYIALVEESHSLSKLTSQGTEFSNIPRLKQILARQKALQPTIRRY